MANLDIEAVIQDLNKRFTELLPEFYDRRIIFWYDEDREFEDKVDDIELDNAKLVKLTGCNNFEIKKLLTYDDKETNYLVYNPLIYSNLEDNWFLGMELYSEEYRSDLNSIWMSEMGLPVSHTIRKQIKEYRKFFNSKERRSKIAQINKGISNPSQLHLAVMATICGIKETMPNSILKAVINAGLENDSNDIYLSLENYGLDKVFWKMVAQGTGYGEGEDSSIAKMAIHIFLTASNRTLGNEYFIGLDNYISNPYESHCYDFLADWLHSDDKEQLYDIARFVEEELNLYERFKKINIEELLEVECFPCINECILTQIMSDIKNNIINENIIDKVVERRRTMAWYNMVEVYYNGILQVSNMKKFYLEHTSGFHTVEAKNVWKEYTEEYYKMDTYYRMYHMAFAKSLKSTYPLLDDLYKHVTDIVEGLYKNWFLGELAENWSNACAEDLEKYGYIMEVPKQKDFYIANVENMNNRVVVIISDALRYDVAASLAEELRRKMLAKVELKNCQAIFPTVTKYGMAALLPHKKLTVNNKNGSISVYADESLTDANYRESVLRKVNKRSIALQYRKIINRKTAEIKEMARDMNVIYLYHNVIDDMGHSDESKVFLACDDAVKELVNAVDIASKYLKAGKIYITSDHGFLYTYSPLKESDKVDKNTLSTENIEVDRRYLITTKGANPEYLLPVKFFDQNSGYDAFTPRESIRIKKNGSGLNFVHGGISLQEMVVPVIDYTVIRKDSKTYKKNSDRYETKPVELNLLSANRKIGNMVFSLSFYQLDPVGGNREVATYTLYFTDSNGKQISDIQKIIADKIDNDNKDRTFRCNFNLKSMKFSKTESYYLNIVEETNAVVPKCEEFSIDIAFALDDFDFFS